MEDESRGPEQETREVRGSQIMAEVNGLVPSDLPQQQDVLEGKLPLEPDEQPAEAEAERAAVLRV